MITRATLSSLPADIRAPSYDLSKVTPGIVHFGVGNFFRAHEATYIHKILALPDQNHWGIIGVGLTSGATSKRKADDFKRQDCLFSLTETAPSGESTTTIIGALCDYLLAPEDPEAVLEALANPEIRIVSMTITEGGYNIDEGTDKFDLEVEAVQKDLAQPHTPSTIFGYVVEGLRRRKEAGIKPFTILSCDNLRHNGNVARKAFLGYAHARDPELAQWIDENAAFPNAMVDRITPTVSAAIAQRLNDASGLDDCLPLVAEDFTQWVLEDTFSAGRPPFEKVGVQMVDDVTDYEFMKIRMLNASHILLAFTGQLLNYEHIDEAVNDPDLHRLLNRFLDIDVIPTLKAAPGENLQKYKESVISRFSNPAMADQTLRIASDGASKIQVFWTVTIQNLLKEERDLDRVAFGLAVYLEMLKNLKKDDALRKRQEPRFTTSDWEKASSDDAQQALQLPAFDGWRKLNHKALDKKIVDFRRLIREKGVKAALPS